MLFKNAPLVGNGSGQLITRSINKNQCRSAYTAEHVCCTDIVVRSLLSGQVPFRLVNIARSQDIFLVIYLFILMQQLI